MYAIIDSAGSRGTAPSAGDALVRVIALCRAGTHVVQLVDERSGERLTLSQLRRKAADASAPRDHIGSLNWQ